MLHLSGSILIESLCPILGIFTFISVPRNILQGEVVLEVFRLFHNTDNISRQHRCHCHWFCVCFVFCAAKMPDQSDITYLFNRLQRFLGNREGRPDEVTMLSPLYLPDNCGPEACV